MARRIQRLQPAIQSPDEGLCILPFGFTINGTSDPDGLVGDTLASVTRSEAGEFLCTLRDRPPVCIYGHADVSVTADDVDIYGKVDWSTVVSAGTFVVRTMTAATQTDPTDDLVVGGFLLVKKTTRRARGG
jgi:hypothetical protein